MVLTRLALILYFRVVAHKAACHNLVYKMFVGPADVEGIFHTRF